MMNHTSTLKRLRLKEILGKCVRKKISQGVGVPGLPRENNAVARYQEFFSTHPLPTTLLTQGLNLRLNLRLTCGRLGL